MTAFLDTGVIYALADRNDADHQRVRAVHGTAGLKFVTHQLILVEAVSLLTKRIHKEAALRTVRAWMASPRLEIVPLAPELLAAGWERCQRFADKEWDWIDCLSFEIMTRRRLTKAFSLDHHFAQAGFSLMA